jgi:hypothetical protein
MPSVRLAVSLHCASDEERNELIPANRRNGGLQELMMCLKEYLDQTGKRITFEWALIEGENDGVETARKLGNLVTTQYGLRRDMVHVNVYVIYLSCDRLFHLFHSSSIVLLPKDTTQSYRWIRRISLWSEMR